MFENKKKQKKNKFFVIIAMRALKSGGMFGLLNLLLVVAFVQHVTGLAQLQQKQQQGEHEPEKFHFERAINGGIYMQVNTNNNNNNNNIKFNDDIRKYTLTSTTPLARLHKFNDKEIDLDAYVNEFDMQDETAIPEDILDQKHIDDSDNNDNDEINEDMTLQSTTLKRRNFDDAHFKKIMENERHSSIPSIHSIGPLTFKASSRSNSNSNIQNKQIKVEEMWHVTDKKRNLSKTNNNYNENYNKPIKLNNNYMNLYNKNNESGIKEMQLEKTAIGDIENVACNEDESFANTNSNMKALQNKQLNEDDEEEQEEVEKELSESVIDRDKSVQNIRTGQTFEKPDDDNIANAEKVQAHATTTTITTMQANGQSALQMAGNINRSRKQRRNLPEMKFGYRRDAVDLYSNNGNDNDDDDDSDNDVGIKTANTLSSPAIVGTPEDINDYKNDYLNIFSIRSSNTSTPNVRLPLGQVQNKVSNGTSTTLEIANKATDELNPSSIVSSSTFEQYKSKQRSNGHIGHKTHKKKYKDYLRYAWTPTETVTERATIIISNKYNDNNMQVNGFNKINGTIKAQSTSRQRKRAQKLETEKSRGFQLPPIFTITSNQQGNMAILKRRQHNMTLTTNRPFYEGQINYYLKTKDENVEQQTYVNDSQIGTAWYHRASPMLRNGLRRSENNNNINHLHQNAHNPRQHKYHEHQTSSNHRYHHKHQQMPHQHTHHFSHALHQRHHHHQQHHHKHNHNHHHPHQNQQETQTAYPAGSSVLGHQITDAEDFERYYAKWPHLARVQFQVYDEHLREAKEHQQKASQEEEYPEYEYGSVAEMEEAQKVKPDEDNLPPYVRKYNRRNKQLLDLLEGPLPPPKGYHWSGSKLQPGPVESSDNAQVIRLDDDYMREKRRRHQLLHDTKNNQLNEHFFAQQQRSNVTTTTTAANNLTDDNQLPDELASMSDEQMASSELKTHMHKLIGNEPQMTWQIEKLLMPTTTTTTATIQTPKALVFRLPSFNSNQVSAYAGMRQRSRSGTGQRRYMSGLLDSMELHGFADETKSSMRLEQQTTTTTSAYPSTTFSYASTAKPPAFGNKMPTMPPRSISAFVYHRVVDNSPRQVGAGGTLQGRKQQLPFVAITDRRLETFKKSLLERQKEFEQNNFPPLP